MTTTSLHHLSPTLVRLPVLLLFALALLSATLPIPAPGILGAVPPGIADLPARPAEPLAFVPNRGQTDPRVRFQTEAAGAEVFFTPAEVVLALPGDDAGSPVVRVRFEGANPSPELAPGAPLVHDSALGNLCYDWHIGDKAVVDAAFARAHKVATLELVNNRLIPNAMEPRAATTFLARVVSPSG